MESVSDEDKRRRLAQQWELDWSDAKDKWRSTIKGKLQSLEQKVIESSGLKKYLEPMLGQGGSLLGSRDDGEGETVGATAASGARPRSDSGSFSGPPSPSGRLRRSSSVGASGTTGVGSSGGAMQGSWLLDGNLAFLGLNDESDAEITPEFCPERSVLGYVKVRVKTLACEDVSKAYFELSVENERLKSPVAFVRDGKAVWELEGRFPVTDLTGHLRIRVKSVSLLAAKDAHLGSVLIPLRNLRAGTTVYMPYPLTRARTGVPGHRRAMGSGLDHDKFDSSLALTVRHELFLLGPRKLRWPLYLRNRRFAWLDAPKENRVLAIDVPKELLASLSEVKRNAARIDAAVSEIFDSLPVLLLLHLRSWRSPATSAAACAAVLAAAKFMPLWAFPLAAVCCVATMCLLSKKTRHENANWRVWNDEIDEDPDQGLHTVQKLAKLAQGFDRGAKVAGIAATLLEKSVNCWNFSDATATQILLQSMFAAAALTAAGLQICALLGINPFGPLCLLLIVPVPTHKGIFRDLRLKALCLLDTIPSHDDLGRAWLLKQQTILVEND
jgi:hypothetical protein